MKFRSFRTRVLSWLVPIACSVQGVSAATHYVKTDNASPLAPFTSWATAATNIQEAVDAAADDATVMVDDGFYPQAHPLSITNAVTVRSVHGAAYTTLDGGYPAASNQCAFLSHSNAVLDGFTVQNGYSQDVGGGIFMEDGGSVLNCVVRGNHASDGGGIRSEGGGVISNCTVVGNYADWGAGVDGWDLELWHSLVASNIAFKVGGGVIVDYSLIRNCLILDNLAAEESGGIELRYASVAENCTIVGNEAKEAGGLTIEGSILRNCIVYYNRGRGGANWREGSLGCLYERVCSTPVMPGDGNTSRIPDFRDPPQGDYRLLPGSPCQDTGTNQSWMVSSTDSDGDPRIAGSAVDLGAYEYRTDGSRCNLRGTPTEGFTPLEVTMAATVDGLDPAGLYYRWDLDHDGSIDREGLGLAAITHTYTAHGAHSVSLSVSNAAGQHAELVKADYVRVGPPVSYVSPSGMHRAPFARWFSAATNLQDAVDLAIEGSTIRVAEGTYLDAPVSVERGLRIEGVGDPAATVIDGGGSHRCLFLFHPDIEVSQKFFPSVSKSP